MEIRLDPDALAKCVDGTDLIAGARQHDAKVEIGRMNKRIVWVEGQPGLVELRGFIYLARAFQLLCFTEQHANRHGRHASPRSWNGKPTPRTPAEAPRSRDKTQYGNCVSV